MKNDSVISPFKLRRKTLRSRVAPGRDKRRAQHSFRSGFETHMRGAAKSPPALYGHKNLGMIVYEFLLLLGRQLHHAQAVAGICERREDFSAHSKIRMVHMRAFGRFRKAKRHAAKVIGSQAMPPLHEI